MKLILKCLPLTLAVLLTLTACGTRETAEETYANSTTNSTTAAPDGDQTPDARTLKEIYDAMMAEVNTEFPSLVETSVDSDNFGYYFGITDLSVAESTFVSEPMMGAIPFGISMIRVKDGTDASAVAAEMKAGIDPHRWICVSASYVETAVRGNVILLVLDNDNERGAAIVKAFRDC